MSLNVVVLTGYTGSDPEFRQVQDGEMGQLAKLRLAVDRVKRGGDKDVEWVPVSCWGKQAKAIATHVGKGSLIAVHGELVINARHGEDGKLRSYPEIRANRVEFLSLKPVSSQEKPTLIEDDDIPF